MKLRIFLSLLFVVVCTSGSSCNFNLLKQGNDEKQPEQTIPPDIKTLGDMTLKLSDDTTVLYGDLTKAFTAGRLPPEMRATASKMGGDTDQAIAEAGVQVQAAMAAYQRAHGAVLRAQSSHLALRAVLDGATPLAKKE